MSNILPDIILWAGIAACLVSAGVIIAFFAGDPDQ
jgi:hypothetical protein